VTSAEKRLIAKNAKAARLSMGEYMRRAVSAFLPAEDEQLLEGMIGQVTKSTAQASAAIARALAAVEASNKRIAAMERQAAA